MNRKRILDVLLGAICAGACAGLVNANLAAAGMDDSRFEFSPDGTSVELDVRDAARRDVLTQLFAGSDLDIVWIDAAFAEERIRGQFTGTLAAVARQLLGQTNFVVVHDANGETSRVVRLVVVGPGRGEQSSTGLAALMAAIKPVAKPREPVEGGAVGSARPHPVKPAMRAQLADAPSMVAEPLNSAPTAAARVGTEGSPIVAPVHADSMAGLSDMGRGDDVAGLLKPPPEDATAPLPVLAASSEAPPLVMPSQALTAMPLTPVPAGTPNPALAPVPSSRRGN